MKATKKPRPVTRLQPRRVELVRPTYQPSKAELEESITLPAADVAGGGRPQTHGAG